MERLIGFREMSVSDDNGAFLHKTTIRTRSPSSKLKDCIMIVRKKHHEENEKQFMVQCVRLRQFLFVSKVFRLKENTGGMEHALEKSMEQSAATLSR